MKASMLALACGLALAATSPVAAQHAGHHPPGHAAPAPVKKAPVAKKPVAKPSPAKKPVAKKPVAKKPVAKKPVAKNAATTAAKPAATPAAAHDHAAMGHGTAHGSHGAQTGHQAMDHGTAQGAKASQADHAAMGHAQPATDKATAHDHAAMGHDGAQGAHAGHAATGQDANAAHMDHAAMGHARPATDTAAADEHAGMDHAAMGHGAAQGTHSDRTAMGHALPDLPANAAPRTPIPAITDADRAAAFPDASGHAAHDQAIHSYWLADRLEWQDTDAGTLAWEGVAWIGGDVHRTWLRTEGETEDGSVDHANVEVLLGRAVTAWWDVVAGVRHDFGEGPSRTWAAFGVQGLAPYKFEVEATAYVGDGGRTAASLEAEYDTLLASRLVLQWVGEATLYGRDDPALGIGSGLSTVEAGARLRYEFTRRFAPYVGVQWQRAFGGTADLRRADGHAVDDTRLVAGVRVWF